MAQAHAIFYLERSSLITWFDQFHQKKNWVDQPTDKQATMEAKKNNQLYDLIMSGIKFKDTNL
jgi:hypothetical protein